MKAAILPLAFVLCLYPWAGAFAQSDKAQNVLIVSSTYSMLPANRAAVEGAIAVLQPDGDPLPQVFTEHLNIVHFPGEAQEANSAAYLESRYRDRNIGVVIALGPQALQLMLRHRESIAPGAPIVFSVAAEGLDTAALPPDVGGVTSQFDLGETVRLARTLQPDAERITVITGAARVDRDWEVRARRELPLTGLKVDFFSALPIEAVKEAVRSIPKGSIILYLSMAEDGAGRPFAPRDVAAQLAKIASSPIYGLYDTYLDHGIVGGFMDRFDERGAEVGRLARDILQGASPIGMGVQPTRSHQFMVDWRALDHWGLDASRLPPDTLVLHSPPSIWDQHRELVLVTIAALALQSAMVIVLMRERRARARINLRLQEGEAQYRHVVDTQTEMICRYRPDTTLTFLNEAFARCFSLSAASVGNARLSDLIPEPHREEFLARLKAGATEFSIEHPVSLPDGTTALHQWSVRKLPDTAEPEFQAVGRDVSALRQAAEEARQRREQVTHLTRVAVLGELSGTLTHQLAQPLTSILSNAQAARRTLALDPTRLAEVQEILDDIIGADRRATDIILRMRALLRKDDACLNPMDMNEIVNETLDVLSAEISSRGIQVTTDLTKSTPSVLGDRVQLQQVLLNLMLNGFDAMGSSPRGQGRMMVRTAVEDGNVAVEVSDNGPGIPPSARDTVFTPFITTKPIGLGLGLSICRTIIETHRGSIDVAAFGPGETTFRFELPEFRGQ